MKKILFVLFIFLFPAVAIAQIKGLDQKGVESFGDVNVNQNLLNDDIYVEDWNYSYEIEYYKNMPEQGHNYQGKHAFYYDNGNIQSLSDYKDGKLNGFSKWFYPNGTLQSESNFKMGLYDGVFRYYSKERKLLCELEYKNNLQISTKIFYENGSVNYEIIDNFSEDFINNYNPDNFNDRYNLPDLSITNEYYENGQIKRNMKYVKGKKDGWFKKYDKNGKLRLEELFENDNLQKQRKYDEKGTLIFEK